MVLTGCHVCGQVQAVPRADDAEAEHHCVRCHAVVHYRKPDHLARTWALLLAAVVFYIPANVLPVMKVSSVLGDSAHTILGGVVELWDMGSWDIALIVFIASVAVPLTKLLALILLLLTEQWRSTTNLRPRTRLYQMVEFIGQWSMLDVFVVILLAALADFQGLMAVSYTHLDVYKRQQHDGLEPSADQRQSRGRRPAQLPLRSVSYTHLDVYKRQTVRCADICGMHQLGAKPLR